MHSPHMRKRSPNRIPAVLIVDDDPGYGGFLERVAQRIGAKPLLAKNISAARRLLAKNEVSLVLLDRFLGKGQDGIQLCLEIKRDPQTRLIPVIVLTGVMKKFEDKIKGCRYGADLYLSKSTSLQQTVKYMKAYLHRLPFNRTPFGKIAYKTVVLDTRKRRVQIGSILYRNFPEKQFNLLAILAAYEGEVVSHRHLIRKLWKSRVRDKELEVLVCRLRRHLGNAGTNLITSIRSQGYCLTVPSPSAIVSAISRA